MKLDYGVIIAVGAALLFYLRLILLQRQRAKRYNLARAQNQKNAIKKKNKKKVEKDQPSISDQLGFKIDNWYILGAGIVVLLFGAFMNASPLFTTTVRSFWWIPIVLGIALLNYTIH
jgi:hypothetical protein